MSLQFATIIDDFKAHNKDNFDRLETENPALKVAINNILDYLVSKYGEGEVSENIIPQKEGIDAVIEEAESAVNIEDMSKEEMLDYIETLKLLAEEGDTEAQETIDTINLLLD